MWRENAGKLVRSMRRMILAMSYIIFPNRLLRRAEGLSLLTSALRQWLSSTAKNNDTISVVSTNEFCYAQIVRDSGLWFRELARQEIRRATHPLRPHTIILAAEVLLCESGALLLSFSSIQLMAHGVRSRLPVHRQSRESLARA